MIKKIFNRESFVVLLYTLISMVSALVIMKLLTVNLSKEFFGIYSLILSIITFIGIFPFRGLEQAASRYVSINHHKNIFNEFYSNYLILFLAIIILYTFVFFMIDTLNINFGVFTEYLWWIFLFLLSETVKICFRTIVGADRKRIELLVSNIIEFGLKISLLLFLRETLTVEFVIGIFIVSNFLSSIKLYLENKNSLQLILINKINFKFHNKRLWLFAYPFLIMATFTWARDMSNRWIIDLYLDKESVGIYSVLTSIAVIVPMGIQTILGSYIVPIIYQKENTQRGFARKVTNILFLTLPILFFLNAIFIYMFSDDIIIVFSSSEYIYNSWGLTALFISFSIYTMAMFSVYEILAQNNSKKLIIPSVISGILSVVTGLILIKYYGLNGAIYSYMIGYLSYAILIFSVVLKYRRNSDIN